METGLPGFWGGSSGPTLRAGALGNDKDELPGFWGGSAGPTRRPQGSSGKEELSRCARGGSG